MNMIFLSQKYFSNFRKYKETQLFKTIVSRVSWDINFAKVFKLLIMILLWTQVVGNVNNTRFNVW